MKSIKELQELAGRDIFAFTEAYGEVMAKGDYAACVGAVGVSCERDDMLAMARVAPELTPDEVLGKVVREVYKETRGERDVADLVGADKGAMCRLCKHACFGCVCGSEARRKADLAAGLNEDYCGMFGRDVLFAGVPCRFWEYGIEGVTDEDD